MMAEVGMSDVAEGFRNARRDAERAIALDPALASAYLALARTQIYGDWDRDAGGVSVAKAAALLVRSVATICRYCIDLALIPHFFS